MNGVKNEMGFCHGSQQRGAVAEAIVGHMIECYFHHDGRPQRFPIPEAPTTQSAVRIGLYFCIRRSLGLYWLINVGALLGNNAIDVSIRGLQPSFCFF